MSIHEWQKEELARRKANLMSNPASGLSWDEVKQRVRLAGQTPEPLLPRPDAEGNYPAVETMRAMLARKIIRRRRAAGLSQVELARRAGIRAETLNRLEQGKHSPSIATVDKLDRALGLAESE